MELRVKLDDEVMKSITDKVGPRFSKGPDLAREAFTLYNWAVEQVAQGRAIVSAEQDGTLKQQVATPSLSSVAKTRAQQAG